jgi:1-acyl-sn-glycerol-3-phosphate acyltransferase
MRWLTLLFGRIWALWGLVTFIVTFLLFFLPSMACYLIAEPQGMHLFIAIARWWMRVWLTLIGCPIKVTGKSNFQPGEAYIVTCNHNALLDVPLSSPFIPAGNKTIAKDSFAKVPLFGWYYRKGSILVNRRSDASRRRSYDAMRKVLAMGIHMCIYPEGTRNRGKEPLKSFYDGAFKLSVDSGNSIIPTIITGTKKAMPATIPFFLLPQRLSINFLAPVSPYGKSVDELKNEVYNIMHHAYLEYTNNQ